MRQKIADTPRFSQVSEIGKGKIKDKWTEEQDNALCNIVKLYGTHEWATVAEQINCKFLNAPKTSKQCRSRWQDHLSAENAKEPWSEKEEFLMILAHKQHKNHWAVIAESLKGRNNNSIKNRFYSIFRRVKNKIMKNDHSYTSKLELLEMLYIISVIDFYLENPLDNNAPKRKRGIDYAYSLVANLNTTITREFREKLTDKAKYEQTMEKLFVELELSYKVPSQNAILAQEDVKTRANSIEISEGLPKPEQHVTESASKILRHNVNMFQSNGFLEERILAGNDFQETSLLFEQIDANPYPPISPTELSAGPAAAAAAACKAACFHTPLYSLQGISDFTNTANKFKVPYQQASMFRCPSPIKGFKQSNGQPLFRLQQYNLPHSYDQQ